MPLQPTLSVGQGGLFVILRYRLIGKSDFTTFVYYAYNTKIERIGDGNVLSFHELALDGKEPVYMQIAGYIKRQIVLGNVSSGERLPSRREIAAQLNINPNTVQKAFKMMEDEGYVHTSGNQGSVIFADASMLARLEEELTQGLVLSFISSAKEMNLSFKKIIDLVSEHWEVE